MRITGRQKMENKGLASNVPQTGSGIMMDAHKPVKKLNLPASKAVRETVDQSKQLQIQLDCSLHPQYVRESLRVFIERR